MFWHLVSCNDEYLSEKNPNEISSGTFWKNLKDTNTGLVAAYNALLDEDIYAIIQEGLRSDMGWPGYGRPIGSDENLRNFYELNYTNSDGYVQNKWNAAYTAIFRANQVIRALENIEETTSEEEKELWLLQMGQARFIRGLMHFYLHSAYNKGSIIIRDEVPVNPEDFNKPLSPSEDVIKFFRQDLEYAYSNLPAQYENPTQNDGRITKGAAAVILGTSYLYEKNYDTAIIYFDDIINDITADYGYKLVEDMSLLFTEAGEHNDESILELNYTKDFRTDIGVWEPYGLSNQLAWAVPSNKGPLLPAWIINAYKSENLDTLDDRNYVDDPDSPTGRSLRPVSLRTSAMVGIVDDDVSLFSDQVTGLQIRISTNGWGFGVYKKYTNHDLSPEEVSSDPRGARASGKNIILNRLADVYLMQAECFIKTGDIDGALELINAVRHRWALELLGPENPKWSNSSFDLENYNEQSLMEHLMFVEKPLEMSLEGHQTRWIDLRRWGMLGVNFQNLSNKTFYAKTVTIKDLEGNPVTKFNSSITEDPGTASGLSIIDYEYDEKAANYNPELHDYLPIPLGEIMRNSNINLNDN